MAIFKRKNRRTIVKKTWESMWPAMGWRRTFHYYRHRLFRTGDSAYKITAGLATGVAVSFTPFLGTHILQAFFFSWLLRASLLAGMIGTLWGNPWTFPFLFYLSYKTGIWICGLFGLEAFLAPPDPDLLEETASYLGFLLRNPVKLLLPMAVGGYLWAILCWPVAYAVLYHPVRLARRAYRIQRRRRLRKKRKHAKGAPRALKQKETVSD